jgi:uncharacterized phage-like protein YoqJ
MSILGKYGRDSEYSSKSKNKNGFKLEKVDDMSVFYFEKDGRKGKALKYVLDSGHENILYANNSIDAEKLEKLFQKWVDLNEPKEGKNEGKDIKIDGK